MNELIRDDDSRDDEDAIEDASYLTERPFRTLPLLSLIH